VVTNVIIIIIDIIDKIMVSGQGLPLRISSTELMMEPI